jgi:hypothetical protein
VFSCRDNDNTDEILEKKNTSYDVYIAGRENSKACYWKNTVKTDLSNGDGISTINIKVENNDIYVTGISLPNTTNNGIEYFWKNNVRTTVKQYLNIPSNIQYKIRSFAVSNGDVYFAGYVENPAATSTIDRYELCYWKNGTKTILYKSQYISIVENIFIDGLDIYVSATKANNNQNIERGYFKNMIFIPILASEVYNFAKNSEGIHFLYQRNLKYFSKNLNTNIETLIGDYSSPIPNLGKIISNNITNDLYTIQSTSGGFYFKNSLQTFPTFSPLLYIQDMFVIDSNIYMIRYNNNLYPNPNNPNMTYNGKVFINNIESQNITSTNSVVSGYSTGNFSSIYVVKK